MRKTLGNERRSQLGKPMNLIANFFQALSQVPLAEYVVGVNAGLNVAAIVAVLVVRTEVKALRKNIEKLENFILTNSSLKH